MTRPTCVRITRGVSDFHISSTHVNGVFENGPLNEIFENPDWSLEERRSSNTMTSYIISACPLRDAFVFALFYGLMITEVHWLGPPYHWKTKGQKIGKGEGEGCFQGSILTCQSPPWNHFLTRHLSVSFNVKIVRTYRKLTAALQAPYV